MNKFGLHNLAQAGRAIETSKGRLEFDGEGNLIGAELVDEEFLRELADIPGFHLVDNEVKARADEALRLMKEEQEVEQKRLEEVARLEAEENERKAKEEAELRASEEAEKALKPEGEGVESSPEADPVNTEAPVKRKSKKSQV